MKIAILNFILSTAVEGKILRRKTNRDTMIYNMARGFVANGHEVTLMASEEFMPLEEETNDFEVVYFPSRIPHLFKPALLPFPKGLSSYLRKNAGHIDMVLAVETFSIPTLIASRICPEKMLIWQELALFQKLGFQIPARLWCNVIARAYMRKIPTVTMSPEAHEFTSKFITNIRPEIIGHGADSTMFYPVEESESYFTVISMLIKRKRIDTIINSFAEFLKRYDSDTIRLKIVGEGPEEQNLKLLTKKLGINNRVDFLGFLPHLEFAEIQRRSIALLINTSADNNMVSITEALANGTPILTNDIPNNSVFIRDYSLGIVCNNWGADQLNAMVTNRQTFHANCMKNRFRFTNTGVAEQLCDIFISTSNKGMIQ